MTDADFAAACELAVETLRKRAPYDTGNLARNAIQIRMISSKEFVISVNESIAPYMPYTNEPWLAERWHGRKNPNEGWFDAAVQLIAETMTDLLKGELHDFH